SRGNAETWPPRSVPDRPRGGRRCRNRHAPDRACQEYRPAAALPGSRAHSADIFLISVTSYPDQSMLAEVVQGGQRFVLEAERYDLITIIGILRVEHPVLQLVAIGTDPGVGLATLHQPYGAGIGHAVDIQTDAGRLEYSAHDVPRQPR